jgi:hypothetical protein
LFFIIPYTNLTNRLSSYLPTGEAGAIAEPWLNFHDRIKPFVKLDKVKPHRDFNKTSTSKTKNPESFASVLIPAKVSIGIGKKSILSKYQHFCITKGFENQATTIIKGETTPPPSYPLHYCLIADCKMKPSSSLYYRVRDLHLDNVMIFLVKSYELYFTESELVNLKCVNKMYCKMIDNVLQLQSVDFLSLKQPRLKYADQAVISQE